MIVLRRILVPTDFSECSEAALRYATVLARSFGSELHLLHVPERPGKIAETEFPIGLFEKLQSAARDRLGMLLTPDGQPVLHTELVMRIGSPCAEIVRYAHNGDVDLIVMGTHGRGSTGRMVLGSVAESVVRKAPCPVLTIHHPQHEFLRPDVAPAHTPAQAPIAGNAVQEEKGRRPCSTW
jgi:nucleotide-binding universal stress UspA family protein